MVRTVIL